MPETTVKDQLKRLIEIQKIDAEIFEIKIQLKEKPARVAELKDQFESTKTHLNELEEAAKQIEVTRKGCETDLQAKEDDITKANTVLSTLKTNKEYTAKLNEIESINADKSQIEEQILKSFDETEAINAKIDAEKAKVAEEEKVFLNKKKEVEEDVKVLEDRTKVLESQKAQIVPEIDKTMLDRYQKIQNNKDDGIAIAAIQSNLSGHSCGGCHMNITQQQINAIKMNTELISCEMCSRILYLEDEL